MELGEGQGLAPAPPIGEGGADVGRWTTLDEGSLLAEILGNEVLAPLSRAVRGERQRKFMAAVATTVNMFQVRVSDMLYSFGQRVPTQLVLHRHRTTLEAAGLMEVLAARISVLAA
jgi:hypothetical protein